MHIKMSHGDVSSMKTNEAREGGAEGRNCYTQGGK